MGWLWVLAWLLKIQWLTDLFNISCFQVVILNLFEYLIRILRFRVLLMDLVTAIEIVSAG